MSDLGKLVRPSVARIVAPGHGYAPHGDRSDEYWGSGFFIAPGWLLTCAHVVGKGGAAVWRNPGGVGVVWQGGVAEGTVVLAMPRPDSTEAARGRWSFPDIALVQVPDAMDARCAWLSDRAVTGEARVGLYGWSRQTGEVGLRYVTGWARGSEGDGKAVVVEGHLPVEGVSGGPLVDEERGAVIGVNKGVGRSEGVATSIAELRRLYDLEGGGVLHEVMRAHDLYHFERFRDLDGDLDWVGAQTALTGASHGFTPDLRARLYDHFAHLPPPREPGEVRALMQEVPGPLGADGSVTEHRPRTWREGAALLSGLRVRGDGGSWAEVGLGAVLLYAAKVVRYCRHHRQETEPARADAAADWIAERATLTRQPARGLIAAALGPSTAAPGESSVPGAPDGRYVHQEIRTDVLLEVGDRTYGDRYPWSVKLLYDGQEVSPLHGDDIGVPRSGLREALREPLADALSLADHGEHLAAVEAVLPRELFDEPIDSWRLTTDDAAGPDGGNGRRGRNGSGDPEDREDREDREDGESWEDWDWEETAGPDGTDFFDAHSMPLGARRIVVIRDRKRSAAPPTPEWRTFWKGVERGPLTVVPLRGEATADGHLRTGRPESPSTTYGRLLASETGSVPVYCGPVGNGPGRRAMAAALTAGHPLVLWRRDGHDHDQCQEFQRQAGLLLTQAGRADGLHRYVRDLRIRAMDGDAADGPSTGSVAVLFDPPDRAPHRTERVRPPRTAGPEP